MSSYFTEMVEKVESPMKTHFFDPSGFFSIIGFLETFNLALYTNRLQEGDAMWVIPFFNKQVLASILKSRVFTAPNTVPPLPSFSGQSC